MTLPQSVTNESIQACPFTDNNNNRSSQQISIEGKLDWSPKTQGYVLSSFFYGYLLTQIIGGNLAERFGAKWIFGGSILGAGILTLLIPLAARIHAGVLIAIQILNGAFQGPVFPSIAALWGRWIPPFERSIVPPAASAEHPRIAFEEKAFLLQCVPKPKKIRTPWFRIATCACGTSVFLVLVGYIGCNHTLAVVSIILAIAFMGFQNSGSIISYLDIANNYAGTLCGITNTLATIPGFVGPTFVGWITNKNQTIKAWRIIFNVSSGIGLVGCLVYCLLFNGEEQAWNRLDQTQATKSAHKRTKKQISAA
ncbi:unnamed protein product [Rotaria sordida]|uniref:Major facilitator superfamily (MFS) profile domain-containing protein n=1 Tax=Rotaria sordida TaxID=392033 RepID=A0A814JLK3_9BILA|nr:unnamed protein product [Rotaria sordida]